MRLYLHPHKVLKTDAKPIAIEGGKVGEQDLNSLRELIAACLQLKAMGIAAPQLGKSICAFVTNVKGMSLFVNPEITYMSPETETDREGCLSIPNAFPLVKRSKVVRVKYDLVDIDTGEVTPTVINLGGLEARAAQHEYDHLIGMTMLDRSGKLEKHAALKGYQQYKEKYSLKDSSVDLSNLRAQ